MASSSRKFSMVDYRKLIKRAQAVVLTLEDVVDQDLKVMVKAYAASVGCPPEFFLIPALTIASSMIGVNGRIKINDSWSEPFIIWAVVAAKKGQKKTAALNVLARAVEQLEELCVDDWHRSLKTR